MVAVLAVFVMGTVLLASPIGAARILCVPVQMDSHVGEVTGAAERLLDYGHDLYLVLSSVYPNPQRYEKRGFKLLTYPVPEDTVLLASMAYSDVVGDLVISGADPQEVDTMALPMVYRDCRYMMADTALMNTLQHMNFDLIVVDGFPLCECNLIVSEYLGIPFVAVSSVYHPLHSGIPGLPHFVPNVLSEYSDVMSLKEKLINTLHTIMMFNLPFKETNDVSLLVEFDIRGTWNDIRNKALLLISTRNYVLEWPLPQMPNFINVPGLSGNKPASLDKEFSKLAQGPHELIVMSFGSAFAKLTDALILKFTAAFARLDQTVVWRLKLKPGQKIDFPSNVHISSWLPQASLLAHPNTRLFITHCGNGGQSEATYHGVPMLGVPLFAEQHHNAFRMENHGIGRRLDLLTLTSDDIYDNIITLLTEPQYKEKVMKLSAILKDRQMSGQEESAYWINHVIQFGGSHLRSSTMDMPLWEFLMLDILLVVVVMVSIIVLLLYGVVKCIIRMVRQPLLSAEKMKQS